MERRIISRTWLWLAALAVGLWLVSDLFSHSAWGPKDIPYSDFGNAVDAAKVKDVVVSNNEIIGAMKQTPEGWKTDTFRTIRVDDPKLYERLAAAHVTVTGTRSGFPWAGLLIWLVPLAFMALLLLPMLRGTAANPLAFGKSRARLHMESKTDVTFKDVAGVDEAKDELREVVDFLRAPQKLTRLGGRLPKGILLVGPPGTGKTLLARAVAGEAHVPFFDISGSEFVELFVGVGASRVRDLFAQARTAAPCIIFIDELDAIGKVRGGGMLAHEERDQTLNQLLVELDGFDPRTGVVLMAATNRPETLDPALLRAGRFDRHVLVDRPSRQGRLEILQVHATKVRLEREADLERVASMTPGLAGADLANIVNEAALLAVRREHDAVKSEDFDEAVERVVAGLARRNRVLTPQERRRVALHEIGHALVAMSLPGADPVQKISIIPRGVAAIGYNIHAAATDRRVLSRPELETKLAVLLGGRAAEALVLHSVSTGAEDDIEKATQLARAMVRSWGMSETLGPIRLELDAQAPVASPLPYSEETARTIDREVRTLFEQQQAMADRVLSERRDVLEAAADALLAHETLTGDELQKLLTAEPHGPAAAA
jgi:cell division protease FtsH